MCRDLADREFFDSFRNKTDVRYFVRCEISPSCIKLESPIFSFFSAFLLISVPALIMTICFDTVLPRFRHRLVLRRNRDGIFHLGGTREVRFRE